MKELENKFEEDPSDETSSFYELKASDYSKLEQQLLKIGLVVKSFPPDSPLQEAFTNLNQVFSTSTRRISTERGGHALRQFYSALQQERHELPDLLSLGEEVKRNSNMLDAAALGLRQGRLWLEIFNLIKRLKIILGIEPEPDISKEAVRVYYWKPRTAFQTGHVSLKTDKIYASFWPETTPTLSDGYTIESKLHSYLEDRAAETEDGDGGKEDEIINIAGLDVKEINKRYSEFEAKYNEGRGKIQWSLLSHRWIDKWRPNTSTQNCSGLVAELLEAGGVTKLISGFRTRNDLISSTIFRLLSTKELGPLLIPFIPLLLQPTKFSNLIAGLAGGLPLFCMFTLLNRNKRHHIRDPNLNIISDLLPLVVCNIEFYGLSTLINSFDNSLLEGTSAISIFILCVLGGLFWLTFDKFSKFTDFLVRLCCRGTDVIIRPEGIYNILKYAEKMGQATDRLKFKVDMEMCAAYGLKVGAALWGVIIGKYTSDREVIGINQGGLIGLHIGILLATFNDLRARKLLRKLYTERLLQYDPCNQTHWPELPMFCDPNSDDAPSLETAITDYDYMREMFSNVLYTPSFSSTAILGLTWAVLLVAYFLGNDLSYSPWVEGISGFGGFLLAAAGYQLTNKIVRFASTRREESKELEIPLFAGIQSNRNFLFSTNESKQELDNGHRQSNHLCVML